MVLPNPDVPQLDGGQMLQLLDARLLIEPPVAALAAKNAAPDELASLDAIRTQAAGLPGGNDELLHSSTVSFHRAVARAADNMVVSEVVDSLLTVHSPDRRAIPGIFDDRQRDHEQHCAILDAIMRGEAALAEERMRAHLHDVRAILARSRPGR